MFPVKEKNLFILSKYSKNNKYIYFLFQNNLSLIVINWLFQGLSQMDKGEKIYHVIIDLLLASILLLIFSIQWYSALFISHTVNWMLNSHFWTFARFLYIPSNSKKKTEKYISGVSKRLTKYGFFEFVIIIGGISRRKHTGVYSDIDIKFIRKKGAYYLFFANLFLSCEKIICFFKMIPLDGYVMDSAKSIGKKVRRDEAPLLLYMDLATKDIYPEYNKFYNSVKN
jgi:hypothetical protein